MGLPSPSFLSCAEMPLVRIGQALAHPLRVRVLSLLVDGAPYRAGMLARRFHVALPLMKQHLLRLQEAELVVGERIDNAVYYRIAGEPALSSLRPLLALGQPGATRGHEAGDPAAAGLSSDRS